MKKYAVLISLILITILMTACASRDERIEFTFDGEECTVTGSTELPTGDHLIPLKDLSDRQIYLWIGQALNGKTWQDGLDLQSYPGEWVPAPDWMPKAKNTYRGYDEETGRAVFRYTFESEGEYHVFAENKVAMKLWPCAPITVFEGPSE